MVDCAWCGTEFAPSGRRRYDTDACRQAAYRARHDTTAATPDPARRATVYECPDCQQRYLDQRRCPECNLFCRRLGTGGPCPHCDEPVAHLDLDS
ncbi:MAG: hypothetical protein ACYDAQ_01660 [Mycobacteriales bacterium]